VVCQLTRLASLLVAKVHRRKVFVCRREKACGVSLAKKDWGMLPGSGTYPARALHRSMLGPDQIGMSEKDG